MIDSDFSETKFINKNNKPVSNQSTQQVFINVKKRNKILNPENKKIGLLVLSILLIVIGVLNFDKLTNIESKSQTSGTENKNHKMSAISFKIEDSEYCE